jgi:hypothetical protein
MTGAWPFLRRLPPGIAVHSLDHGDAPCAIVMEMPDYVADALAHLLDAAHEIADLLGFPGSDGPPPRLASVLHAAALHQPQHRCPHQSRRLIPEAYSAGVRQPEPPSGPCQAARLNLGALLHANCPQQLRLLLGPFPEVGVMEEQFHPDLMVAHRDDLTAIGLLGAPLLVVEIVARQAWQVGAPFPSPCARRIWLAPRSSEDPRSSRRKLWISSGVAGRVESASPASRRCSTRRGRQRRQR